MPSTTLLEYFHTLLLHRLSLRLPSTNTLHRSLLPQVLFMANSPLGSAAEIAATGSQAMYVKRAGSTTINAFSKVREGSLSLFALN